MAKLRRVAACHAGLVLVCKDQRTTERIQKAPV